MSIHVPTFEEYEFPDNSIGYVKNGYEQFKREMYPYIMIEHPTLDKDKLLSIIGKYWIALPEEKKRGYKEKMVKENLKRREIYNRWMQEKPKRWVAAYLLYSNDMKRNGIKVKDIKTNWNGLKKENKAKYIELAKELKQQYFIEMDKWREQEKYMKDSDSKLRVDSVCTDEFQLYMIFKRHELSKKMKKKSIIKLNALSLVDYKKSTSEERKKYISIIDKETGELRQSLPPKILEKVEQIRNRMST